MQLTSARNGSSNLLAGCLGLITSSSCACAYISPMVNCHSLPKCCLAYLLGTRPMSTCHQAALNLHNELVDRATHPCKLSQYCQISNDVDITKSLTSLTSIAT